MKSFQNTINKCNNYKKKKEVARERVWKPTAGVALGGRGSTAQPSAQRRALPGAGRALPSPVLGTYQEKSKRDYNKQQLFRMKFSRFDHVQDKCFWRSFRRGLQTHWASKLTCLSVI